LPKGNEAGAPDGGRGRPGCAFWRLKHLPAQRKAPPPGVSVAIDAGVAVEPVVFAGRYCGYVQVNLISKSAMPARTGAIIANLGNVNVGDFTDAGDADERHACE